VTPVSKKVIYFTYLLTHTDKKISFLHTYLRPVCER